MSGVKYLTAIRLPSESSSSMFLTTGMVGSTISVILAAVGHSGGRGDAWVLGCKQRVPQRPGDRRCKFAANLAVRWAGPVGAQRCQQWAWLPDRAPKRPKALRGTTFGPCFAERSRASDGVGQYGAAAAHRSACSPPTDPAQLRSLSRRFVTARTGPPQLADPRSLPPAPQDPLTAPAEGVRPAGWHSRAASASTCASEMSSLRRRG